MTKQTKDQPRDAVKLRAKMERGRRAQAIVDDPIFIEALDAIEKEIETGWKNSSSEDRQARDNAYMLHRLLVRLKAQFKTIIVNGGNAKVLLQLEEIKERAASQE